MMEKFLIFLTAIAVLVGIEFLIIAGLVKLVCFVFGFTFSWRLAIGIWAIIALVSTAVKSNSSSRG